MATNITINDSITYAPVVGANVFVNGAGQGTTNNSGQISFDVSGITYTLSASATAYTNQTVPNLTGGIPYTMYMVSSLVPTTSSFQLTVNPEDPAIGEEFTFDNVGSPISAVYSTGGVTVPNLTPGPQIITSAIDGYLPTSTSTDTSRGQATIELTAATDTGMAQATSAQAPPSISPTANTLPALTSPTNPEFIPPNTGQGTYFTITQARMYIGRVFIDELNGIQFALQNNKIPIYGYASRDFDAIAQGKSLVQGQFTINFISEGYLNVVLKDYAKNISSDSTPTPVAQQNQSQINGLVTKLQNPDPAWTPEMIANAAATIQNLVANGGPSAVTSAKASATSAQNTNNNSILGLAGGDYPNAVYQDVGFDIVIQYEGAGRTVTRRIEGCRLISNESIMDHSGTPILDSYGFIARRLR